MDTVTIPFQNEGVIGNHNVPPAETAALQKI